MRKEIIQSRPTTDAVVGPLWIEPRVVLDISDSQEKWIKISSCILVSQNQILKINDIIIVILKCYMREIEIKIVGENVW